MTDDETIMVDATTMMIKVNNTMGIIKMIIIVITRGESRMNILKGGWTFGVKSITLSSTTIQSEPCTWSINRRTGD
jgi:hypothetical protein